MNELSACAITQKWPPNHPERIQLYSLPTPNGVKASIMLEETGLPYEPHLVRHCQLHAYQARTEFIFSASGGHSRQRHSKAQPQADLRAFSASSASKMRRAAL